MRRDWEKQKEKLFEELGRHQPLSAGGAEGTPKRAGRKGFDTGVSPIGCLVWRTLFYREL